MKRKLLTKKEIDSIMSYVITYDVASHRPYFIDKLRAVLYMYYLGGLTNEEMIRLHRRDFRWSANRVLTYHGQRNIPKSVMVACLNYFSQEPERNNAFNLDKAGLIRLLDKKKTDLRPKRSLVL